jgi:hypothetical protein
VDYFVYNKFTLFEEETANLMNKTEEVKSIFKSL